MAKLVWDQTGEHLYETGVKNCALYPVNTQTGAYTTGVAWNGITGITESPSGADPNPLYADDIKYLNLRASEEFGATIEAYTYPDEFAECDGTVSPVTGVKLGQQKRKMFGLAYITTLGNDTQENDYGYKIHIIYGATASPSERGYSTINDSPEAITFSWELTTTPVEVTGYKPVANIEIDSTKLDATHLTAVKNALFGTDAAEPYLPLPDALITLAGGTVPQL